MKKINIGIIGFGTVGAGVVKILRERKNFIAEKIGTEIEIKKICDKDITTRRNVSVEKKLLTRDAAEILSDPQIDIVVELIGGINPAREFILEALKKGKHIVTANKALLAQEGNALFAESYDRSKNIYFEASVGAGIPIIKSLKEGLVANKFSSAYGILNGTSNYILSRMSQEECSFETALKEAQKKGFAEKDPTLDIEGFDTAHKLLLLTYLCFGKFIPFKDVYVEGISRVSLQDIQYARELGFQIKLLAVAKKEQDSIEVRVHPTLLSNSHMLASVNGVFNAIYVQSDLAGDLLFYGPGAGQLSAASAVVSDIVDLTQDIKAGLFRQTLRIIPDQTVKTVRRTDDFQSKYYVRIMALDNPGVLSQIAGILAKFGISIASVSQKERHKTQVVPIVMVFHEAQEKNLRKALDIISKLNVVKEKPMAIRIEEF